MDVDFPSDERLHTHLWEFWRPASLGWAKKEHSPLAIWPGNEQFLIIQFIHSKTIHPSLKIISPIRHGLCPLFKSIWTLTWLSQWKHTVNTFRDDIYCISDGKPEKNIMALLTQKKPSGAARAVARGSPMVPWRSICAARSTSLGSCCGPSTTLRIPRMVLVAG